MWPNSFFFLFQNEPNVPSELWDGFYPKLTIDTFMFFPYLYTAIYCVWVKCKIA